MPARTKTTSPKDSTANLGFEATALRGSANPQRAAILRSPLGNRWLTADKLRNNMDAAAYSRAERDRLPREARMAGAEAPVNHVVLGLIFLSRAERDRSHGSVTRRASRGLRVKYISDTFRRDLHPDLRADYVLANPPFNDSERDVKMHRQWPMLRVFSKRNPKYGLPAQSR